MSSASPSSSGPATSVLTFLAIIVLIIVYRIFRNLRGVRVSEGRTIGYIIFYFAFGGFFIATSFFEGVSYLFAIPDALLLVLAAYWSHKYSDRRMTFWRGQDGYVYYKGGIIVYLIYVAGLIARLSVEFIVIGPSAFTYNFSTTLTGSALTGTIVTDLLLSFGIGLLVGRNLRVYDRVKRIKAGKETLPTTPGEYSSLR